MPSGPLHVVPLRPVSCGSLLWALDGVLRATVYVKATFSLVADGKAQLAAPAEVVTADRLAPPVHRGDLAPAQSVAAASDAAPYLPTAGVLVTGSAYAPLGLPTPAMAARLAIFGGERPLLDKMLHVFGDRTASSPTPRAMTTLPLVYERAFGGLGVEDNPVGVGANISGALPNIVDPADARRPAGFGPVAATWGTRRRLLAGAPRPVVERGALELSEDVDWRYFHAAPTDQQLDFLAGDEWIVLDGLSPEHPRFRTKLPGARGLARYQSGAANGAGPLRSIELSADTLAIDTDRRVCSVVWRGHIVVDSPESAAELRVFAGVELPGFPIPWPNHAVVSVPASKPALSVHAALADRRGHDAPDLPTTTQALPVLVDADESTETTGRVLKPSPAQTLPFASAPAPHEASAPTAIAPGYGLPFQSPAPAASAHIPPAMGSSPRIPPPPPPSAPARGAMVDEDSHTTAVSLEELRSKLVELERAPFKLAQPGATTGTANKDLPGAPWSHAPSAKPPVPDEDMTAGVRVPPPEFLSHVLAERQARSSPAAHESPWAHGVGSAQLRLEPTPAAPTIDPGRARDRDSIDPGRVAAPMKPASAAAASDAAIDRPPVAVAVAVAVAVTRDPISPSRPLRHDAAVEIEAPMTVADDPIDPGRSLVIARMLQNETLDGVEAQGANLADLDFTGRSMQRALLRGANLARAQLSRASLGGADLGGVDLTDATLDEADLRAANLEGATLTAARLCRAKIGEANFTSAKARGASFEGATGERPNFAGADLEGATLRRVELPNANLRGAKLGAARFEAAVLPEAQLGDASGEGAVFDGVRMPKAHAQGASLPGASFRSGDLEGSSWERAKLPRASFEEANLRGANLQRAAIPHARFDGADLSQADLQRANGEHADFRNASLDGADLRKMQALEACFADVAMHRANADKANFTRASFAGADLRGSSFRAAVFIGANGSYARLEGADLRDADLSNAVLRGCSRAGAKMVGATLTGVDEGAPESPKAAPKVP